MGRVFHFFSFFFIFFHFLSYGQMSRRESLTLEKLGVQAEIKKINELLFSSQSQKKSLLFELKDIELKIDAQERLLYLLEEEMLFLDGQISLKEFEVAQIEASLVRLKKSYASLIWKSYKSKSVQNRLMFLFSSRSFFQAYKRFQYLQQYASYRKKQAHEIHYKQSELKTKKVFLVRQKGQKEAVFLENVGIKDRLAKEKDRQSVLVASLEREEARYVLEIKKRQLESAAIDRALEKLIAEAISRSNKGNKNSIRFILTAESKLIAANFIENKGNLPWPVERGLIIRGFGTQRHPVVRSTVIKSNGISIATPRGSQVRSIFRGEVLSILSFKRSLPTVLIRHGNYVTAYKNLSKVYVEKGDKVMDKQNIGEVFTHPRTGETTLQFSVFYEMLPEDPTRWIQKI